MKGHSLHAILPIAIEKIVAGAAVAGCVVLALRTLRLLAAGAYLASRKLKGKIERS